MPMLYVLQCDVGLVVIDGFKIGTIVLHDDFVARICPARVDEDVERFGILVHAVLDGIFDDGLKRQRRHAKIDMRRVIVDEEAVFKLSLFHGEVGAGMLQFLPEGNGFFACDGGEVLRR